MASDTAKTIYFAGFTAKVEIYDYANGGPCIKLIDPENYGPIATATSWIPGLKEGEVAIKDYSENQGILDVLLEAKVITSPHRVQAGFPVAYLT